MKKRRANLAAQQIKPNPIAVPTTLNIRALTPAALATTKMMVVAARHVKL
ncbi:MAG: hypothetical protein KIS77_00935 [Saprospiraceae bacterium]|nr:hypothetical protein [Saprospiraceae bacterium]